MIQSKIIHVTMFLTKRNALAFIQMGTDEKKFSQIRNASGTLCVQVRRVKKFYRLSWTACANVLFDLLKVVKIPTKFLTCSK